MKQELREFGVLLLLVDGEDKELVVENITVILNKIYL